MRQSQLFTKTRREAPKDEESTNARLLIRAGFINKEGAGIYTFLPLGLRVLKNIADIVREGMEELNAQEMLMPALHPKQNWDATGRWKSFDAFKDVTPPRRPTIKRQDRIASAAAVKLSAGRDSANCTNRR